MPKPNFFRRLLGKKERDESDEYEEDQPHHSRRRTTHRVNQSFMMPERSENYSREINPYHTNKVVQYRKGTRSCVAGRLDDPTSDSDEDAASVHTEVKSYRSSKRHGKSGRKVMDVEERVPKQYLREMHVNHRAQRREFLDDEVAWGQNRIEQLEKKVETTSDQLYRMTNKWMYENNRYNELNDKYHRIKEKYILLKQKHEDLQNSMIMHQPLQPPPFMNPQIQGTPNSYNFSLMNQRSASLLTSPVRPMPPHIPNLSKFEGEMDEVKHFRGASGGARETLMSEASTSRVSNPSPAPEVARTESLMSIEIETPEIPADDEYNDKEFNNFKVPKGRSCRTNEYEVPRSSRAVIHLDTARGQLDMTTGREAMADDTFSRRSESTSRRQEAISKRLDKTSAALDETEPFEDFKENFKAAKIVKKERQDEGYSTEEAQRSIKAFDVSMFRQNKVPRKIMRASSR
ncbi:unnamed protein product [Bursaphelenchus okinawaensis]|uniref:Uncharacterized protein n=1 Tax=Bursaphelenchus okinawaensis TaxID=465554 RepID=A0A811K2R3_9BILA|nr:unnamed protein product [Bursaphelenchus okinawaensis]CAG9090686.1 unnamed protein product [Bursaphelenchus okinawaensis]